MEKMIDEIIDSGLLRYAADQRLKEDDIYKKDVQDAARLHAYIRKMLSEEYAMALDDYEAIMMSANSRAQEIAYLAGVSSTIAYLKQTGALKIV